jgi:hypothetical protein
LLGEIPFGFDAPKERPGEQDDRDSHAIEAGDNSWHIRPAHKDGGQAQAEDGNAERQVGEKV